jgi:hypothetical protein
MSKRKRPSARSPTWEEIEKDEKSRAGEWFDDEGLLIDHNRTIHPLSLSET